MARRSMYDAYHGRGRSGSRALLFLLLGVALLALIGYFWIQPYIVYSADGVRVNFPWNQDTAVTDPPPVTDDNLTILPAETPLPLSTGSEPETPAEIDYTILKNPAGIVFFETNIALAGETQPLDEHSGSAAVVYVFLDQALVTARPDAGITMSNSRPWTDGEGRYWSSPTKAVTWEYHKALLKEAAALGYDELVLAAACYPPDGDFSTIPVSGMYNPGQLSAVLALFYQEMAPTVSGTGVSLSIWAEDAWLLGEDNGRSGQTGELLLEHFDRIWYSEALENQALELIFGGDETLMAERGHGSTLILTEE